MHTVAHNKKIKSTALDIRQPAAVQQSISYLTILALLLVFHQDSFQKRAGAEATPRDTSHYHQSYNYSMKYLGKITIVFIHIFKINYLRSQYFKTWVWKTHMKISLKTIIEESIDKTWKISRNRGSFLPSSFRPWIRRENLILPGTCSGIREFGRSLQPPAQL